MRTIDTNLVFGYGDGEFNPQDKTAPDTMYCRYGRAEREPTSFRDEAVRTAKLIAEQATKLGLTPCVLLSGGMDSEVVVKAFIEARVDFKTITFRYNDDLNSHELAFTARFLSEHRVPHSFFDIRITDWAHSAEARELFLNSYCSYFEMVPHMKLMLEMKGILPVLGNGEALLLKTGKTEWQYVEYEYDLAWYRFSARYGVPGAMGFFQHTPEMTLAMLREPSYVLTAAGRNRTANVLLENSRQVKYNVYKRQWPDIQLRTRKFDGGEKTRKIFKPLDKLLTAEYPVQYDDKWLCPLDGMLEMLTPLGSA